MPAGVHFRTPSFFAATVIAVAAVTTAASAQGFGGGKGPGGGKGRRQGADASQTENAKKTKAREGAYQDALKRIPDGKPETDPWKGAR